MHVRTSFVGTGGLHSAPAVEPGPQGKEDSVPTLHGMKKSDQEYR